MKEAQQLGQCTAVRQNWEGKGVQWAEMLCFRSQFYLVLLSYHLRILGKMKRPACAPWLVTAALLWDAVPAALGPLGFCLKCCFNGFENYLVAQCGIEACVANDLCICYVNLIPMFTELLF